MKNMTKKISVLTALLTFLAVQTVWSVDYYVAKTGSDSNSGTVVSPWLTIQKAANTAIAGSTVNIMAGTYNEKVNINVSGSAAFGYITFQNYGSDTVIMDGTGLSVSGDAAMLNIDSKSYIRIKGLQVCNLKTSTKGAVPMGIFITGIAGNIEIRNNYIHHIANTAAIATGGNGRDAHGLAVYGTSGTTPISNLVIDGNEIAFCTLGSSESMVVNGNVDGFQITNNVVHDNDNIGIDCIGFEGTAPTNDQARNGLVQGNTVYNITSLGNPSYPAGETCADGIYVDGGRDIVIERNVVHHVDIGIEVASEHSGKTTTGVTVRSNLIYKCNYTGLAFGGYSATVGSTANCSFIGNTLIQNDTNNSWTGDILVQKSHDNIVKNNIIYTSSQNIPVTNPFGITNAYNNTFDYNLYFTPGGANNSTWNWNNKDFANFAAYKTASGQDAHSIFANPLFVNLTLFDIHLQDASPAVDGGDSAYVPATGEKDLYGDTRLSGAGVDIGASESGGNTQPPPPNQSPNITTAAWVTPSTPVASTPATVDLRATDPDNGPSALSYTWSKISGSGTVTFNISGASSASARIATFSEAGSYVLGINVTDGAATTTTFLNVTVQAASAVIPGQVTTWILPGTTTTLLNPTFTWSAATNAGCYLLKVDNVTTGQTSIISQVVTATTYTAVTSLTVGNKYQAVVTAQNSDGTISGTPSPVLVFTVQSQTIELGTPTQITPKGTISDLWPWCEWTRVKNAEYYQLRITDLTTGTVVGTMKVTRKGTSFNKGLTPNHSYSWTVRACRNDGTLGAWSTAMTFKESSNAR
jgi:hypothetical protein